MAYKLEQDETGQEAAYAFVQPYFRRRDDEDKCDADVDHFGGETLADGGDDEVVEDEKEHKAGADAAVHAQSVTKIQRGEEGVTKIQWGKA